ncbi:hypothetical protein JG687_00015798 [Phytophthora cactorum]|uniref:Uncharacterized protein n=1 Tax=Phytophthora cactorum TaxID=29920 RepID=A0A8T1TVZ7_9STRA|nr:hypothetical protein PC121_g11759 [Phytophthora cactorum]KAG4056922.1 hypothetical protein PC123_g8040 [Phytophthora cactorum]KAG6947907.1 hypothetical protein JG687_00015798 [Phytophthora cactorum]
MRYHARGMIRSPGNRTRERESFEYITFTIGSPDLHDDFDGVAESANRGLQVARQAEEQDVHRRRIIRDEMSGCRRRQRAEKEHLRSSQRAATKTLARRLTNANASMEEIANQVQQLRAAQAPTTERLRRRHEDERLEFQAYLEEEIPRTDVKRIYTNEIRALLVTAEVSLQTLQVQNARRLGLEEDIHG